jgi:hypothetical protein
MTGYGWLPAKTGINEQSVIPVFILSQFRKTTIAPPE